jgi:hypothetical protein
MPTDRQFDESFDRAYECTPLESVPLSGIPFFCYPGGHANCQVTGPVVEVVPHSDRCDSWVGSFAEGDISPNAASGVFSCPSPRNMLVVAKGEAYIVNVDEPSEHYHIKLVPVMGVVPVPEARMIVLYDFIRLEGYGGSGRCWQTPSLSWDGLRNIRSEGQYVVGEGWDSPNDTWVPFRVDARDGAYTGGASPELLEAIVAATNDVTKDKGR